MKKNEIPFNTPFNPAGPMNAYGCHAFEDSLKYPGNHMEQEFYMCYYEATYEGIAKILPPPLEVDRSIPPLVMFLCWESDRCGFADGRRNAYTGCAFLPACKYVDSKGNELLGTHCAFEYIDGPDHDMTTGAEQIVLMGFNKGYNKKLGNCTFHRHGDAYKMNVVRRGEELVNVKFYDCQPIDTSKADAIDKTGANLDPGNNLLARKTIGVREIPSVNHRSLDLRSIVVLGEGWGAVQLSEAGGRCEMELGHMECDPLDLIKPVKPIDNAIHIVKSTVKDSYINTYEYELLPGDPRLK